VNIRYEVLDWFGPSCGVIALHSVLMYYAIEISSSIFLSESFGGLSEDVFSFFSMWIYLSIYSRGTAS
jgi:hypothetical protein